MTQKQRILEVLADGGWHTSAELYRTGCVLHSRISDLRNKDGYEIERRNVGGVGAQAHEYRLFGGPLGVASGVNGGLLHADPPASGATPSGPAELSELDGGALDSDGQLTLTGGAFMKRHAA